MGKAAAVGAVVLTMGGALMGVLTGVLGPYAEATSLGLVGMGLFATSQALGQRIAREPTAQPSPQQG